MKKISEKYNKSIAQISLRWCLQNNFIILPKSKTESRIKENIDLYDFELTENDIEEIRNLHKLKVRACWNPHSIQY